MKGRAAIPLDHTGYQLFRGKPYCDFIPEIHVADRHLHQEVEIAFIQHGQLTVRLMDKIEVLVPEGALISIGGSTLHKYIKEEASTTIVKIKFMKSWLFMPYMDDEEKESYQHLLSDVFVTHPDPVFNEIFMRLFRYRGQNYNDMLTFSMIVELLTYILNHPETIRDVIQTHISDTLHMEQLLDYMQKNYTNQELTLGMLAKHMNLSESYCSRFFSKTVQMTFMEYLNTLRTNNIQYMLINTDWTITEIQERSGFSSIQTFNRVFKNHTNISPREFRKKHRSPL